MFYRKKYVLKSNNMFDLNDYKNIFLNTFSNNSSIETEKETDAVDNT